MFGAQVSAFDVFDLEKLSLNFLVFIQKLLSEEGDLGRRILLVIPKLVRQLFNGYILLQSGRFGELKGLLKVVDLSHEV